MSSDSTDEGKVPHYAYPVLRIFPPFTIEIVLFRLLTKPLFRIETATSFTNILIWGCIILHYSNLTSPKCISFRKFSLILLGYCENFRGNCGTFHWLLAIRVCAVYARCKNGNVRQLSLKIRLITIASSAHYISKLGRKLQPWRNRSSMR